MSLKHQFIMVDNHIESYNVEDVLEYFENNDYIINSKINVDDDILQALIFDEHGNVLKNIQFNEWGVTIINRLEIEKWINIINEFSSELGGESNNSINGLEKLFVEAKISNRTIIHLGI